MSVSETNLTVPTIEIIRRAQRCLPDVEAIADAIEPLRIEDLEQIIRELIESAEDDALGLLMLACGMRGIVLDPDLLCDTIGVVAELPDMAACFAVLGSDAIAPLLRTAEAEHLSWQRQAITARIAAELSLRDGGERDAVLRLLNRLETRLTGTDARLVLLDTRELLQRDPDAHEPKWGFPRMLELKLWKTLPGRPPPKIIGDGRTVRRPIPKLGRNEPCHCGSGKKYKRCCYEKDQEILRDASHYEGLTQSEIEAAPGLVDDREIIDSMRAYQIAQLDPKTLSDFQLLAAYRRADTFGQRELAYRMLLEAEERGCDLPFEPGHFEDLMESCLGAGELEMARTIRDHLGDGYEFFRLEALEHEFDLLEHPERLASLNALCLQSVTAADAGDPGPDDALIMMAHANARQNPALAIAFARAAMIQFPERTFDNEMLLDLIREIRADINLDPWSDPAEALLDTHLEKSWMQPESTEEDEETARLRSELSEARGEIDERQRRLQDMESTIAELTKEASVEDTLEEAATAASAPPAEPGAESARTIERLRQQVDNLKVEISEQQEHRRGLRKQLSREQQRMEKLRAAQPHPDASTSDEEDEGLEVPDDPGRLVLPVFDAAFQEKCRELPESLSNKAMRAVTGFAIRDPATWRQTKRILTLPHTYRIRIGIHYRLLLEWIPSESLRVLDLIPRAELETWLRRRQ